MAALAGLSIHTSRGSTETLVFFSVFFFSRLSSFCPFLFFCKKSSGVKGRFSDRHPDTVCTVQGL